MITDNFGRAVDKRSSVDNVTGARFDVYDVGGMTFKFPEGTDFGVALNTINAHAPEGWTPPPAETPEDTMSQLRAIMEAMGITELKL